MAVPSSDLPSNLVPQDDLPQAAPQAPAPQTAAPAQSSGAVSADDLPANLVPKDDLPSSLPAPSPIKTPHTYDTVIRDAAQASGLDVNLLRSLGMQETGLGSSGNYNPKTGTDRDGNKGRGLFQLDPASGVSQETLQRAAKDPGFASKYAAGMLKNALRQTNGDLRGALAIYNSGSATSDKGLAYADEVISRMGNMDKPDYDPVFVQKVKHDAKIVQSQLKQGKSLDKALARTRTAKPLVDTEVKGVSTWQWAKDHPLDAVGNIIGAPQHLLGGFEHDSATGREFNPQHILDYVFNPTDKNNEASTAGPREVINRFAKDHFGAKGNAIPTHGEIDSYVRAHVHGALEPYVAGLAKGGEDFITQAVSDPLQLELITKLGAGAGMAAASGVAKAAHATAKALGIGPHMAPYLNTMSKAADALSDVFVARRDLDKAGFTKEGKGIRLAIENSAIADSNRRRDLDSKVLNSAQDSVKRVMEYIRYHGNQLKSNAASNALGMPSHAAPTGHLVIGNVNDLLNDVRRGTPEERAAIFADLRRQIEKATVVSKTKKMVGSNPKYFSGHPGTIDQLGMSDTSGWFQGLKKLEESGPGQLLGRLSDMGKRSVMWNPAPHGLKNVGTLAYLAGGIPAVMHGIHGMIKGVDSATVRRLEQMGAAPLYAHESTSKFGQAMDSVMERMEQGWRAGLLHEMDRKLGPSKPGSPEEMLKGHLISKHIGDYRNQSAFVHTFKTLGGPFVAFRLGIVPANVAEAAVKHPGRVNNVIRLEQDVQNNRTKTAQRKNRIVNGGPVEDASKLGTDPKSYLTSPSTTGLLGQLLGGQGSGHTGLVGHLLDFADAYIPGASAIEKGVQIAQGNGMPGQKSSFADMAAQAFHDVLMGGYVKRQPTAKQEHKKYKTIRKQQGL